MKDRTMGGVDTESQPADNATTQAQSTAPTSQPSSSPAPFTEPKPSREINIPSAGISEAARFIIDTLKEQRDDWKRDYLEERDARKKLLGELDALEKKHRDYIHETELNSVRGEKSTLKGLAESGLMQYIGPAIQEVSLGMAKAASQKMGGLVAPGGNLQGVAADIMSALASWIPTLDETSQQTLWSIVQSMAQLPPDSAQYYLTNFLNLIQRGTTARTGSDY